MGIKKLYLGIYPLENIISLQENSTWDSSIGTNFFETQIVPKIE